MGHARADLHAKLKLITPNVYFQPPAGVTMAYPCIVYHRDDILKDYADNVAWNRTRRYLLTVIDRNPDSTLIDDISALPQCNYNRSFAADDLNHDVFTIYF